MHRFFVSPAEMAGERFPLPPSIAHQVRRVLRLQPGERLILLDGLGSEATCRLAEGVECVVESRGAAGGEPRHRLTLVLALLRGDHLEAVIRNATEVGVADFQPMVSERCVARHLSDRRLSRLRAVAREAAEQSERGLVPPVAPAVTVDDALAAAQPGSVLLFERDAKPSLAELAPPPVVFIGPEGGFTPDEVSAARRAGLVIAGLGPRILRSETAALAAAAIVLSAAGEMA